MARQMYTGRKRWAVVFAIVAATTLLMTGWELRAQSVEQNYAQRWAARERSATSVSARQQLTRELIQAASLSSEEQAMRLYLCQRAYAIGSRDRECFPLAAKALELMQQIDPSTRLDALQKLRQLYQRAYEAAPSRYLGMGVGLADATIQIAEQRRQELDARRSAGELQLAEVIDELSAIQREYQAAQRVMQRVLMQARSLADSTRGRNAAAHEQLAAFIERNQRLAREIDAAIEGITVHQGEIRSLIEALEAFRSLSTALRAERVAQLYLIHLDSPAEAVPYAELYMEKEKLALLKLAASPEKNLSAEDALKLAQWYMQIAQMAPPAHQPRMYIRAYNYLSHCNDGFTAGDERLAEARQTLATLQVRLMELGVEPQPLALRAMGDRGEEPAVAAVPTPPARPSQDEPTIIAGTTPADPGRTAAAEPMPPTATADRPVTPPATAATTPREPATATATLPTDRAGRPIATCIKCRFEFSPLPGDSTTLCPRCASGRRNIFDFGDE